MHWLVENLTSTPEVIKSGGSLLLIQLPDLGIRFVDSINFLNTALHELPTMFGRSEEFGKGFFPYRQNHPKNYGYRGPLPPPEDYGAEWMGKQRRAEFDQWYSEKQRDPNYVFDLDRELRFYCRMDVTVLRECCEQFRKLFFEQTSVDPFQSVTIASACNVVFRKLFLKPNTIAIVPSNGYAGRDRQSLIAKKWLIWEEHRRSIKIRHAGNGVEERVNGRRYKLDGVEVEITASGHEKTIKHAYEFYGCFFHGVMPS